MGAETSEEPKDKEKEPLPFAIFEGTSGKLTPGHEDLLQKLLEYYKESLPPSATKA